jgi:hypothetical protein
MVQIEVLDYKTPLWSTAIISSARIQSTIHRFKVSRCIFIHIFHTDHHCLCQSEQVIVECIKIDAHCRVEGAVDSWWGDCLEEWKKWRENYCKISDEKSTL